MCHWWSKPILCVGLLYYVLHSTEEGTVLVFTISKLFLMGNENSLIYFFIPSIELWKLILHSRLVWLREVVDARVWPVHSWGTPTFKRTGSWRNHWNVLSLLRKCGTLVLCKKDQHLSPLAGLFKAIIYSNRDILWWSQIRNTKLRKRLCGCRSETRNHTCSWISAFWVCG